MTSAAAVINRKQPCFPRFSQDRKVIPGVGSHPQMLTETCEVQTYEVLALVLCMVLATVGTERKYSKP